ncbi:hypothetical protein D3C84_764000 [compost metagenome]
MFVWGNTRCCGGRACSLPITALQQGWLRSMPTKHLASPTRRRRSFSFPPSKYRRAQCSTVVGRWKASINSSGKKLEFLRPAVSYPRRMFLMSVVSESLRGLVHSFTAAATMSQMRLNSVYLYAGVQRHSMLTSASTRLNTTKKRPRLWLVPPVVLIPRMAQSVPTPCATKSESSSTALAPTPRLVS